MEPSDKRKELASKILEELMKSHSSETQIICELLGYKLDDLFPASPEQFTKKGVTSDLKSIRFTHHEERRIAKITKIAEEICNNPDASLELVSLLSLSRKQPNSRVTSAQSLKSEFISSFTRPQDMISFGLEKERMKFNRSVEALQRISFLRNEAKSQAETKRKGFDLKSRIIAKNRSKITEEFQKTVQINVDRRKKILQNKHNIVASVLRAIVEYGIGLEKRMHKLADWQKIEIRKKIVKKREKLKKKLEDQQRKFENELRKTRDESLLAGELIENITRKIDTRVNEYLGRIQSRVQSAHDHSLKVANTLQTSVRIDNFNQTQNLRRNVNKSLLSTRKVEKKGMLASESSQKMKKMLNESFQKHQRGVSEVTSEDIKRMQRINQRFIEKQKKFESIQKTIVQRFEEKKQKNFVRMERHFRAYIEKQRDEINKKQKVLDKHKKLSMVADELNSYKNEVAVNKRRSNLQIQRMRSSRVSPSSKFNIQTARIFDQTY